METSLSPLQKEALEEVVEQESSGDRWELKKLKPIHQQICSLLGQGFKNVDVAKMTGVTKEYITVLLRQPLIRAEVARMADIAGVRLEAMFEKSVDVIADAMDNGNHSEKLKAARLHGELTKRIGRGDGGMGEAPDTMRRLELLAERLTALQATARNTALEADREKAEEVSFREVGVRRPLLESQTSKQESSRADA